MGICSSCLQRKRHHHTHIHTNESEALLNNDTTPQYGGLSAGNAHAVAIERARARARETQPDPDMLRREREEMERICQGLAGKLIDVTAQSHATAAKGQKEGDSSSQAAEAAPSRIDYAKLFDATFTDYEAPQARSAVVEPSRKEERRRSQGNDSTFDDEGDNSEAQCIADEFTNGEEELLESQKQWLRRIIDADQDERRWDWTRVHPIEGRLTLSFDDF